MKLYRLRREPISLCERIERYVDACPAAISGQRGHNQTFKVAISLVRGFALSQREALVFLRRYNERCYPPWSERELRHKLVSAANFRPKEGRAFKSRGYLI
jgi:hypothetical protein